MLTSIQNTPFDNEISLEVFDSFENEELIEFLDLFIEQLAERVAQLEKAYNNKDLKNIEYISHKIASCLSTMGIVELIQIAGEIETECSQNQLNSKKIETLIQEAESIIQLARQIYHDLQK